jgi:5-amino-6-(5-phosphoribosylamino)uracil reductase
VNPASRDDPGPPRPQLRLVLAISLDGRLAPVAGGAAQIGGPGDRRVLEEGLAWADGCLIGAETLRRHGTTCLIHAEDLLEQRRQEGQPPQPLAIAVSRRAAFPADLPFFAQPLERWLLTQGGCSGPAAGFQRVLPLASWSEALAGLAQAGVVRLLVLGGAQLVASLLAEGWMDELQLTLCPRLLGGPHQWLPAAALVAPPLGHGWQLVEQRRLEGEELMLRYRLDRSAALSPG